MKDLFDALFFPKPFFSKPVSKLPVSIVAFLVVYYTDYCAYFPLFPVSGNVLLFLFVSVAIAPFFLFFLMLGIDLVFAGYDQNRRLQNLYGFTFCPYLFLPFVVAFARREGLFNQVFGFSLFAVLFLWSSLLTYRACEKKRVLLSKTIHDLVVLSFLLRF